MADCMSYAFAYSHLIWNPFHWLKSVIYLKTPPAMFDIEKPENYSSIQTLNVVYQGWHFY